MHSNILLCTLFPNTKLFFLKARDKASYHSEDRNLSILQFRDGKRYFGKEILVSFVGIILYYIKYSLHSLISSQNI